MLIILCCKEKEKDFYYEDYVYLEEVVKDDNFDIEYECKKNCEGKECGDDGCGGVCGKCEEKYFCYYGICKKGSLSCGDMSGLQDGAEWPMFRYCPTLIGRSPFKGPKTPHIKWSIPINYFIYYPPVIDKDKTIYFTIASELYALRNDGSLKWKSSPLKKLDSILSISNDGTIYGGGSIANVLYLPFDLEGYFYAITTDGKIKWSVKNNGYFSLFSTIGNDNIIYVSGVENFISHTSFDGVLYAFKSDGNIKWKFIEKNQEFRSPAIGLDGFLYFSSNNSIYSLNTDGDLRWKIEMGYDIGITPVIASDGTLYIGGGENCEEKHALLITECKNSFLFAITPDGKIKWKLKLYGYIDNYPVISKDGTIFIANQNDKYFYSINPNGSINWVSKIFPKEIEIVVYTPVIDSDGIVYVSAGSLYAIDNDGIKWIFNDDHKVTFYSAPVLSKDGTIYIVGENEMSEKILFAIGEK